MRRRVSIFGSTGSVGQNTVSLVAGQGGAEAYEVVALSGSVEIAPGLGLCDCIVDVVESGRTLAENGLEEVEDVAVSSARLIVNRASFHARRAEVAGFEKVGKASSSTSRRPKRPTNCQAPQPLLPKRNGRLGLSPLKEAASPVSTHWPESCHAV